MENLHDEPLEVIVLDGEIQHSVEQWIPDGKNMTWLFDAKGNCIHQELTRENVLKEIHNGILSSMDQNKGNTPTFQNRDFRHLEGAYAMENKPILIIRNQVILLNIDQYRIVILREKCYVLNYPKNNLKQLQNTFQSQLYENPMISFEFIILESILSCIFNRFKMKLKHIQPYTDVILQKITSIERPRNEFEKLRFFQNKLQQLKTQIEGIHQHLVSLLDNDEDLHLMHITELYNNPQLLDDLYSFDADEAESLVEVYSQKMYGILASVQLVLKKTQNTESSLNLKWTSKRNQLLMVDVPLKVMFLAVWLGAIGTAMPAMNLESKISQTPGLFWSYFTFLILFCIWIYWFIIRYLRKQGIPISFKAPTTHPEVHLTNDLMEAKQLPVADDNVTHRQALCFSFNGNMKKLDISRTDMLKMIQAAAKDVPVPTEKPQVEARGLREKSRSRQRTISRAWNDRAVEIPVVHMRDVRMLENALSNSTEHSIAVRQQAILINCDPIRAVILRDRCIVLLPEDSATLAHYLSTTMKEYIGDAQNIEFEFTAFEAILATACHALATEQRKVCRVGREQLELMAKDEGNFSVLENLRAVKDAMSDLETQVSSMHRMLMELLDNEEDLHMLHLTKIFKDPSLALDLFDFDTEDTEALIESYLQDIYRTQTDVLLMLQCIQNTEAIVMMKLDTKRNYLIVVDLLLTLLMTVSAFSNLYVNAFAMNLLNNLKDVIGLFWIVNGSAILLPIGLYYLALGYIQKEGIKISWVY